MGSAPVRRDPTARVDSAIRRRARTSGPGSYGIRRLLTDGDSAAGVAAGPTSATASPIAASFFAQTRTPDVDTVWQSDDGDTSYVQWVNLTGFSGGEAPYGFPVPFDYDSPAGSTVTAVHLTVTARQTVSDGYLAVGLQAPDGTWLIGTAAAYATLEPLALTGSWQTFTFTVSGLTQDQGGASTAATAWTFYVANGNGSPAVADESVRMSYVSVDFTLAP